MQIGYAPLTLTGEWTDTGLAFGPNVEFLFVEFSTSTDGDVVLHYKHDTPVIVSPPAVQENFAVRDRWIAKFDSPSRFAGGVSSSGISYVPDKTIIVNPEGYGEQFTPASGAIITYKAILFYHAFNGEIVTGLDT